MLFSCLSAKDVYLERLLTSAPFGAFGVPKRQVTHCKGKSAESISVVSGALFRGTGQQEAHSCAIVS